MIVKLVAILFMSTLSFCASSNNAMNQFLLAAQTGLNEPTEASDTRMNVVSSFIEEAQFRFNAIEGNEFDANALEQSYEIRVKPKAWGQSEIEENILDLRSNQQNNHYNVALNTALKNRYLILLSYLEQHNTTQYFFKLANLATQEIRLIRREVMGEQFNTEKLLGAVEMFEQSKALTTLNLARLNSLQSQIAMPLDSAESVLDHSAVADMVDFAYITDTLSSMNNAIPSTPDALGENLAVEMAQAKSELIKAKHQLGVNLLSFAYKDSHNDSMAFQLGINIPLGTHFNKAESQYELYAAKNQLGERVAKMTLSLTRIQKEIAWLAGEIKLADTQIQRVQKYIEKEYIKTHPLLTITLRKELIEHQKKRTDIQIKALKLYVDALAISGHLIQEPLRNWIQSGAPELMQGGRR